MIEIFKPFSKPIWPERTSTIGSIFSGTFDGSAATFMFVKVLYDSFGVPLRSRR